MEQATEHGKDVLKIWELIKDAHSALLVTVQKDGSLDSRPMGCIQREFDGTIWFFTFSDSKKIDEIAANERVLVSYSDPEKYEYVSLTGHARVVADRKKFEEFWSEAFRVWFPSGLDDPDIRLLSIEVAEAKYWTNAASAITYAWAYLKARVLGESPKPEEIVDTGSVRL